MNIKISIQEPCRESWSAMTPSGPDCRYCAVCERSVTDFTQKTDLEILQHFQNNGKICGRFRKDQLDRPFVAQRRIRNAAWLGWAAGIWSAFAAQEAIAQSAPELELTEPKQCNTVATITKDSIRQVSGLIRDVHGAPLIGASVRFSDKNIGAATNINGYFSVKIPAEALASDLFQLKVTFTGFSPIIIPLPDRLYLEDICLPPIVMEETYEGLFVLGGPMVIAPKPSVKMRIKRFFYQLTH